jgi:L-iditol 2-dehydrogenase
MRRAIFVAPGEVNLEDIPAPRRAEGKVLIAVRACGLCTWEQRVFRGTRPQYPLAGGHEIGGDVVAAPAGAHVSVGDRVAVSLVPRCGCCGYCNRGQNNLCAYMSATTTRGHSHSGPGGLSELISVPTHDAFRLPAEVSADAAALVEPTACVLHSLSQGHSVAGGLTAIFGLGFMGRLHVMCARARHCRTIGVATSRDSSLAAPHPSGQPDAVLTSTDPSAMINFIRETFNEPGVDAAICIRGGAASLRSAMKIVRPGGKIVLFESIPDASMIGFDPAWLRGQEISMTGSLSHTRSDFSAAADLVAAGTIDPTVLISRKFTLDETRSALEFAIAHPGLRTIVQPNPV